MAQASNGIPWASELMKPSPTGAPVPAGSDRATATEALRAAGTADEAMADVAGVNAARLVGIDGDTALAWPTPAGPSTA